MKNKKRLIIVSLASLASFAILIALMTLVMFKLFTGTPLDTDIISYDAHNCRYTDLGDSHEYTEFDENNKMIYSMEYSHNYDENGVCINCGHNAIK